MINTSNKYYLFFKFLLDLFNFLKEYVSKYKKPIDSIKRKICFLKSMGFLKDKAKTLEDIWNNAQYISKDKIEIER